jgi:type VI secretion system protein ImpF
MPDTLQYGTIKAKEDARYKPFLLRRLTDFEPSNKQESAAGIITARQLKEDVFENIEMLFNSRSHPSPAELKGWPELEESVLSYGVPDYCGKTGSPEDREMLRQYIITQLRNFEPRLMPDSISVDFIESQDGTNSLMEFKINGIINVGEISEEVLFISKLDVETGNAEIVTHIA